MGSCIGNKCADINETSLLPELMIGNSFPGITSCVESCGGPGCGCFHWDSGCLFYRIYGVPKDDTVYELFKCARWEEEVKLRLQFSEGALLKSYVLGLRPNVPIRVQNFEVTLSVLSVPPLPVLEQKFVRSKHHVAIWNREKSPLLRCPSHEHALSLQCTLHPICECTPAESQIMCRCEEDDIEETFMSIENVLPLIRQQVHLSEHPYHSVMAKLDHDISAEIILNMKEAVTDLITEIKEDSCSIENTHLTGCYQCSRGAQAIVTCKSTLSNTSAEVECGKDSFTVPCSVTGTNSQLDFLFESARVHVQCSVRCGRKSNHFELTGILKTMSSSDDELSRKRRAEERKLIDEIRI
ncbi:hypothetical protein COOONC_26464 [Cooperia oncophora]